MEALMARKLTTSMVVQASKAAAQKWIKDKTTPKQSLLAAFGAEDHGVMVSNSFASAVHLISQLLAAHTAACCCAGFRCRFNMYLLSLQ